MAQGTRGFMLVDICFSFRCICTNHYFCRVFFFFSVSRLYVGEGERGKGGNDTIRFFFVVFCCS